jgi:hypothetical protein
MESERALRTEESTCEMVFSGVKSSTAMTPNIPIV